MRWKANVTVAAVIEQDNKFLLIEEDADGERVINQPAGHLEEDESLLAAVIREAREETARDFQPQGIVGIYQYTSPNNGITYLRVCYSGQCIQHYPDQQLDEGIIRTMWLGRDELLTQQEQLRSPLVLRCIDDYLAGINYPLELVKHIEA